MPKLKEFVSFVVLKNLKKLFKVFFVALPSQNYESAIAFFADDATVFFREGSYYGKFQIKMILKNTFSIIKDETFEIQNLDWNHVEERFATCTFEYNWSGTIQGKRFVTPGRGSLAWANIEGSWRIVLEHFGPMPN